MTKPSNTTTPPDVLRMSRWSIAILIGVNLVLAGYVAVSGDELGQDDPPRGVLAIPEIFEFAEERLPANDAAILHEAYRPAEQRILEQQAELSRALARTITSLGDAPFDMDVLRASIADARQKKAQLDDLVIDTFLNAVGRFSPDGRRKLVSPYKLRKW